MKRAWHQQAKAKRTDVSTGGKADSKGEARRWEALVLLERAGVLRDLKRQPRFPLVLPNGLSIRVGRSERCPHGRTAVYTADAEYHERQPDGSWKRIVEDFKGYMDPLSKFRIAVFEAIYGLPVRVAKSTRKK